MYNASSKLYNKFWEIYFDKWHDLSDAKRNKIDPK